MFVLTEWNYQSTWTAHLYQTLDSSCCISWSSPSTSTISSFNISSLLISYMRALSNPKASPISSWFASNYLKVSRQTLSTCTSWSINYRKTLSTRQLKNSRRWLCICEEFSTLLRHEEILSLCSSSLLELNALKKNPGLVPSFSSVICSLSMERDLATTSHILCVRSGDCIDYVFTRFPWGT